MKKKNSAIKLIDQKSLLFLLWAERKPSQSFLRGEKREPNQPMGSGATDASNAARLLLEEEEEEEELSNVSWVCFRQEVKPRSLFRLPKRNLMDALYYLIHLFSFCTSNDKWSTVLVPCHCPPHPLLSQAKSISNGKNHWRIPFYPRNIIFFINSYTPSYKIFIKYKWI